ncbi:MAG TPA: hypothetical protein VEC01_06385 [Noviherbaspirillum sp.]|uniref:hypothetical protein n=1 Tax=Noviherbaspirillum sp. TaxID=1926288 RepID=UPI002D56D649|nr:hypothetical protein [Noviherbaspirillum sp.]HYD94934.1 hypothetical protein [Noviherbaspirillum sp.]
MKQALVIGAVGILVHTIVLAQPAPVPGMANQATPDQRSARAQQLLDAYRVKRATDAIENRKTLDEAYVLGIRKTRANVMAIRTLLVSRVPAEEKVALARLLGSLYSPADATGMNAAIAQDLRRLARAEQRELAGAAVLVYSRLGYFPDTPDILSSARRNGAIDDDGYFGELAHLVPFAPAHAQRALVAELRRSKNPYGTEVITFVLQAKEVVKKLDPAAKEELLLLLNETEPAFPMPLGDFGYTDAIRFANWLHASAMLAVEIKGASYRDMVLAKLDDERTDPRKIMAFLSSGEGRRLIGEVGQRAPFEKMQQRIALYSRQLPQNEAMKEIVDGVNATLAGLKP